MGTMQKKTPIFNCFFIWSAKCVKETDFGDLILSP